MGTRAARAICHCAEASHRAGCRLARIDEERALLYSGLYEPATVAPRHRPRSRVRLLNPAHVGDDATSNRFALIEMD